MVRSLTAWGSARAGATLLLCKAAAPPPAPSGLIELTANEVQQLFAALVARPVGDLGYRLR